MLEQRLYGAALLVPLVLAVFIAGQPWITGFVAVLAVLGAFETFALLRRAGYPSEPWLGAAIALVAVADAWLLRDVAGESALLIGAGLLLAALAGFLRSDPREGFQVWMVTLFGAVYAGLISFVIRIMEEAPALAADAPLGGILDAPRAWLLLLVLCVWGYDTGAYALGRAFGSHRFLEHLSPSKTLEGTGGGLVSAMVVGALVSVLLGRDAFTGGLLGLLIGVAAQAGDFAESMLKRAAGAKESGRVIPGHGGILDRVDSFLFAAPVTYFYLLAVTRAG